jgi:hypothetical protein
MRARGTGMMPGGNVLCSTLSNDRCRTAFARTIFRETARELRDVHMSPAFAMLGEKGSGACRALPFLDL